MWHRILLRLITFAVGAYVTSFVVMNVTLESGALAVIVNHLAPNHVHIEYASAWSPWLSRVHTKGFSVRGADSAVEWRITLDEAKATFGVMDFFQRRVHLRDAQAKGVSVRMRFKVKASKATPDYVAKLPPIAGLPDPPLEPAVLPPAPDDAHYALWTVQVDDCDAEDIREVWADTVRITDVGGWARGGFYLKPLRHVNVRPTELHAKQAIIRQGSTTIASDVSGVVAITVHDYDIREVSGLGTLRQLDGRIIGSAKVDDLYALDGALDGVTLRRGRGGLELSVGLERGKLLAGTRVRYVTEGVDVAHAAVGLVSAATRVSLRVPHAGKPHLEGSAELMGLALHNHGHEIARAPYVGFAMRADNVDLSEPFDRGSLSGDVPSAVIPNVATLEAYTGSRLFDGGEATLSGHANLDSSGRGESNVTVDLRDASRGSVHGWWATLTTGPVAFHTKKPWASGTITGKCKDAQLPLDALGAPAVLRTAAGHQQFTVSMRTTLTANDLDASDFRAIGDSLEIYAHYHDGRSKSGAGIVITPAANVGFEIASGSLSILPLKSRAWYETTRPRLP